MFYFTCVSAHSILNGEIVKVRNLSRMFLISLQINSFIIIIRLSGWISSTIRPDSRITGYQPDIRCDLSSNTFAGAGDDKKV